MTTIRGKALTTFDVASDGRSVSINVIDENAGKGSLVLPAECLAGLIMTLPEMMRQSMQRQYRDSSLRLVYPARQWQVEKGDTPDTFILTLQTPDGFQVSFAVSRQDLRAMSDVGTTTDIRPVHH